MFDRAELTWLERSAASGAVTLGLLIALAVTRLPVRFADSLRDILVVISLTWPNY